MPAKQRGFARKRGSQWLAVWRENNRERSRGGFDTKTAALDYANTKANEESARARAIRFGDKQPVASSIATVAELVEAFLARHRVDEATTRKLRAQLKHATASFGDRRLETLQPIEIDVWRSQLPALSAHYLFRAFRQVLEYAVDMGLIETNPTRRIKNVRATADRRQILPFETWEQVEAITLELDPRYAAIPIVLAGTGLRPEELWALERRDVDLDNGVLSVERVHSQGVLKDCRKSSRQRRRVPLRQRVVEALRAQPPRLDTPLLFPAARGGPHRRREVPLPPNQRSRPRGLSTAACTTAATPSRPGRSPEASSCSTWRGSWARPLRRSTRPTGTCCPTARSTCAGSSTTTTWPRRRRKEHDELRDAASRPAHRSVLHAAMRASKRAYPLVR